MAKYVKRPIVIDAIQLAEETVIHTLEGDMKGGVGDWLITGVNGELYPCKDDIFQKTYREQSEAESAVSGDTSDGYHTFDELYHHRAVLFAVIVNSNLDISWKSKFHSDGTMFDNFFIAGIKTPEGDYSYHFDLSEWDLFQCNELAVAPEWDGHMPDDVGRLLSLNTVNWEKIMRKLLDVYDDAWKELVND